MARFDRVTKAKGYKQSELLVYLIRQVVEHDRSD
jgi:hypothetical protein